MQILTDSEGYVCAAALEGAIAGGREYCGMTPLFFEEYMDCFRLVGGTLALDAQKLVQRQKAQADKKETDALYAWFAWYDRQLMQYQRAQRLGEGFGGDVALLDRQAKQKQARLRELLSKGGTP